MSIEVVAIIVQTLILAVAFVTYNKRKQGTENDKEVAHAERHAKTDAEIVHIKQEQNTHRDLIAKIDRKQDITLNLIKRLIKKDSKNA